jgi:hypothetical protein
MTTNIGTTDRLLRLVLGLVLLSLTVLLEGNMRWIGLVGIVPLATAVFRWCPAYSLFGLNTCATRNRVAPQG